MPAKKAPGQLVLPVFGLPKLMWNTFDNIPNEKKGITLYKAYYYDSDLPAVLNDNAVETLRLPPTEIDIAGFMKFIAKIAHGFAWANKDRIENFNPILPNVLLTNDADVNLPLLVGGDPTEHPAEDKSHVLMHRTHKDGSMTFVGVRLFAWLGAPVYYAVVSTSDKIKSKLENRI